MTLNVRPAEGDDLMRAYIGTKRVNARPMNRREYNILRGWTLPENENGDDLGYLVEEFCNAAPNVDGYEGYVSWSPVGVFCASHNALTHMSFGDALALLKDGGKVARAGWNGRGMYLYHVPANRYAPTTDVGCAIAATQDDGRVPYGAYIAMKTAQNDVVPWLASQTDVLADDWVVVSNAEEVTNG